MYISGLIGLIALLTLAVIFFIMNIPIIRWIFGKEPFK